MKLFSEYLTEVTSGKEHIEELERLMFSISVPAAFKSVLKIKDKSFFFATRENLNIWADQNGYDVNRYQRGSKVDVLRNYGYNSGMMSKKMEQYISGALDYKEVNISYEETFVIDSENEFTVKYIPQKKTEKGFPSLVLTERNGNFFFDRVLFKKHIENLFEMKINGTGAFSWNKYRNRKGISPESAISKKDLEKKLYNVLDDAFKEFKANTEYRNLTALQMVDEVIRDNYIKDTKELINQIKFELENAYTVKEFKEILKRYEFSNIPSDDVLENIMKSVDFQYDREGSVQYGHSTGTMHSINFEKRVFKAEGYSSDD
jgi:hypothetical protein